MLEPNTKVEVESIGRGSVGYQPMTNPMIKRKWSKPGVKKMIPLEEIKEVMSTSGGEVLFKNHLLIKDIEVRRELDLPIEEARMMGEKELEDLLKGNPAKMKSVLPDLSKESQKRLAQKAAEMKVDNMNKLQMIKEYSGIDVYKLMEAAAEKEKEKEKSK